MIRLEQRDGVWVVIDAGGGITPASCTEIELWQRMRRIDMEQAYTLADKLYDIGYRDARAERDYDPRGVTQWQAVVTALLWVAQPKPNFYTACSVWESDVIALPRYSATTADSVKNLVLAQARREGYKGTADERIAELGWEVLPAYIAAQPLLPYTATTDQPKDNAK